MTQLFDALNVGKLSTISLRGRLTLNCVGNKYVNVAKSFRVTTPLEEPDITVT